MAKTTSDIQAEVRTYLDESSEVDFKDTEVLRSINRAYQDVAGHVMEVYDRWYETTTPFTYAIVSNQQEYTIDPSLVKVTRVEINYNPTVANAASRAVPLNEDEVRGNLGNTNNAGSFFSAGYFLHGNIGAQKIGFIPVPQTADPAGTESIAVWGIALPSDLVNAGDNVNIPYADRYAYLISLKAASQLLRKGQQEENTAQNYINEYKQGILEMITFLKDRQSDDGQFIIDSTLEQIDFSTLEIV